MEIVAEFSSKSQAQGIPDAIKLAVKCGTVLEGKKYRLIFTNPKDKNLKKLLALIEGRTLRLLIDGEKVGSYEFRRTFFCEERTLCKGICKHEFFIGGTLDEFLPKFKSRMREGMLPLRNEFELSDFLKFVEPDPETENRYVMDRDIITEYFTEKFDFERKYCDKFDQNKLDAIIQQLPTTIEVGKRPEAEPAQTRARIRVTGYDRIEKYIDTFYQARIFATVIEQRLRNLFKQIYPETKISPPEDLDVESLLLGLEAIPEDEMGSFYYKLSDRFSGQKKIDYLKKALEHFDDETVISEIYYEMGDTLLTDGRLEEARDLLNEGLKRLEDDFMLLERLAEVEIADENLETALEIVKRVLEDVPEEVEHFRDSDAYEPLRKLPEFQELLE